MLDWTLPESHKAYLQERYDSLTLLEGVVSTPYVDSVGVPTIGIGFNLRVNLEPVLKAMIGKAHMDDRLLSLLEAEIDRSYAPSANSALAANLDRVMANWHATQDDGVPKTFAFNNEAKINRALSALDDWYDGHIDGWVASIPESSERAALFSLCWNAPSMLGPKLQAAIETGNRAEAWYEIRYNSLSSSLPDSVRPAIAYRRYVEADQFSLYDADGNPSKSEALEIGRMILAHHDRIAWYEESYDPLRAAAIKGVDIGLLGEEIASAVARLLSSLGLSKSLAIDELLVAGNGIKDIEGDTTGYETSASVRDLLIGDRAKNMLDGGAGNDILVGDRGRDLLTGGAGADLFVFTRIADSRSNRADRITDFQSGADRIALSKLGSDLVLLDEGEAFSGHAGEIRFETGNGRTTVEIDLDGDRQADMMMILDGAIHLTRDDFLL